MRAGKLRHQILIESATPTQNSMGESTLSHAEFATVRAEVMTMPAKEMLKSDQILGTQNTLFRIRYIAGLDLSMRITYDGRYFDIESIVNVHDENHEMRIVCKEIK